MRRRLTYSVVLTSLALIASGCTNSGSGDTEEIPIGVVLEQTGNGHVVGVPEANALRLVAEQVNERGVLGDRKIKLIYRDNKSDPKESAKQVKSLVDDEKVVGVIGAATTATTLPMIEFVEQRKVPMISMAAADEVVQPVQKRQHVFKTTPNGAQIVEVMMREFASAGIKKIGLLAVSNPYGDGGVRAVTAATQRSGVTMVGVERYGEKDTEYTDQVNRLVEAKPDAILLTGILPGAAIAARDLKQSGYQGRVYADPGTGAELFLDHAGTASEGMYMVHTSIIAAAQIAATTPAALAQKEFFTAYTQKYGNFSGYASYAADALNLMVEAMEKSKSTDRAKIRDALESLSFDGLTGSFQFGPGNHGGPSGSGLTVVRVRRGAWVLSQ